MKNIFILFVIYSYVFPGLPQLHAQSVQIQGKLKLDPNQTIEYNDASYALVLDTANALALKALQLIGVPTTDVVLSEIENNAFLLIAGFAKIGRILLPIEGDDSTVGSGSISDMTDLNALLPMAGTNTVWKGIETIIWDLDQNNGGRYDLAQNQCESILIDPSPSMRNICTGIWTSSEQIIRGCGDSNTTFSDGEKYNPVSSGYLPAVNTSLYLYSKN